MPRPEEKRRAAAPFFDPGDLFVSALLLAGAGYLYYLTTTFEEFERHIRDQLARMLVEGGFDPARDIEAITVNRYAHGNAYAYGTLSEPAHWALQASDDRPCVIARLRHGRISIANSDAAASPFTDAAFDEAHRAVREVILSRSLTSTSSE